MFRNAALKNLCTKTAMNVHFAAKLASECQSKINKSLKIERGIELANISRRCNRPQS
jgi:hypothetical protein